MKKEDTDEIVRWPHPIKLKFVNKSPNPDPVYAKPGDSCFDIRAWVEMEGVNEVDEKGQPVIVLKPGKNVLVHTGLYFELPKFTEIQVRPRSGNAINYHISVTNSPGTVDEGYRNELGVILENRGDTDFIIHTGDRIAQGGLCPIFNSHLVIFDKVAEISTDTERGLGGFGHSGIK